MASSGRRKQLKQVWISSRTVSWEQVRAACEEWSSQSGYVPQATVSGLECIKSESGSGFKRTFRLEGAPLKKGVSVVLGALVGSDLVEGAQLDHEPSDPAAYSRHLEDMREEMEVLLAAVSAALPRAKIRRLYTVPEATGPLAKYVGLIAFVVGSVLAFVAAFFVARLLSRWWPP